MTSYNTQKPHIAPPETVVYTRSERSVASLVFQLLTWEFCGFFMVGFGLLALWHQEYYYEFNRIFSTHGVSTSLTPFGTQEYQYQFSWFYDIMLHNPFTLLVTSTPEFAGEAFAEIVEVQKSAITWHYGAIIIGFFYTCLFLVKSVLRVLRAIKDGFAAFASPNPGYFLVHRALPGKASFIFKKK